MGRAVCRPVVDEKRMWGPRIMTRVLFSRGRGDFQECRLEDESLVQGTKKGRRKGRKMEDGGVLI